MSWGERTCKFYGYPGGCPHGATFETCNTGCPHYVPKEPPNPDSVKRPTIEDFEGLSTGEFIEAVDAYMDAQAETITRLRGGQEVTDDDLKVLVGWVASEVKEKGWADADYGVKLVRNGVALRAAIHRDATLKGEKR